MIARLKSFRERLLSLTHTPPAALDRSHKVHLFHWRPPDGRQNFGDHLSNAIVTKMAAERACFLDEMVAKPQRLLAIGSIIHYAADGDVVWGSGVNGSVSDDLHTYSMLDVRSVRGPLTANFLEKRGITVPQIFGDPALLTARLMGQRFARPEKKAPVAYIPHFLALDEMRDWENMISPYLPWAEVIRRILAAEHVISSSLHGLVIADTFGIPCTYLRLDDGEALFKYEDYVLGAGRERLEVTTSKAEAVRASPMPPIKPQLDTLYGAFPWDLWD